VTRNYSYILSIVETVRRDTPRLFADMVRYNAHGKNLLRELGKAHRELLREVRRRDDA
jgi:hypothetical protein